jgi:hypothetical protein
MTNKTSSAVERQVDSQNFSARSTITSHLDYSPYRGDLKRLTGSIAAAILLEKIVYFAQMRNAAFYKFAAPCTHQLYRAGDSWQEEVEFTRSEFETALKKIATKITRGASKKEIEAVVEPVWGKNGRLMNADKLVIYFTDSNRVTWFKLNFALLKNALDEQQQVIQKTVTPGNARKSHYLVVAESPITLINSITTASTTASTTHTPPPPAAADGEETNVCVAESNEEETKKQKRDVSKFKRDVYKRYVEHLIASGLLIINPGGYISKLITGCADEAVQEWLDAGAPASKETTKNDNSQVGAYDRSATNAPAPLSDDEVKEYAEMCQTFSEHRQQPVEVTLGGLSVESGGCLLAADIERVRAAVAELFRAIEDFHE